MASSWPPVVATAQCKSWWTGSGALRSQLNPRRSRILAVSAGGDRAAIARGTAVELYALPGGHLLRRIEHAAPVSAVAAGADGTARVWDGATGTLLQTYRGWPGLLADAILTPDGLVIGGDADGSLRFWDAASGAKL